MRYSIIIPAYNAEKTIARCLDSILNQGYNDYEIVLINDGSTDETGSICEQYANIYDNVKYFSKTNGGVSSARNLGIEHAFGEFICFVDSDDFVDDHYFEYLNLDIEYDLVIYAYSTLSSLDIINKIYPDRIFNASYEEVLTYFVADRQGSPWNKRFKRAIIKKYNIYFPEDISIGEDFVFCFKYFLSSETVKYSDCVIYNVDITCQRSITRSKYEIFPEKSIRIYEYAFKILLNSRLNKYEKTRIERFLDFNYCRTMFAVAFRALTYNQVKSLQSVRDIVFSFSKVKRKWYKPVNLLHCVTQIFVDLKMYHLTYLFLKFFFFVRH